MMSIEDVITSSPVAKPDMIDYLQELEVRRAGDCAATAVASIFGDTAISIEVFGDSTGWGATVGDLTTKSASNSPDVLQATLREYYGNEAVTVTNSALSGTRLSTMLAGTDGSGHTFEYRVQHSAADIIVVTHGINTVGEGETAAAFKSQLKEVCNIVRQAGKALVLCTQNPVLAFGFGVAWKTELQKLYMEQLRTVAAEEKVILVDNYKWLQLALASGNLQATAAVGDGVHPMALVYAMFGRNWGIALIKPSGWLSSGAQFMFASDDCVLASGVTVAGAAPNSLAGLSKITPPTGDQTIRFPVVIAENGLDLYIAYPVWGDGASAVTVKIDGEVVSTEFSMSADDYSGLFLQDFETCIKRQILPGLHLVELSTEDGSIGLYYARVRPTLIPAAAIRRGTPSVRYGREWLQNLTFEASGTGDVALLPEFPTSSFIDGLSVEFTAQLNQGSGIVVCGGVAGDNVSTREAKANIIVGLFPSTGYLAVWEGGGLESEVLGDADLSAAKHDYRITISSGLHGTVTVYVDGDMIGDYELTRPYYGGSAGVWSAAAGTVVIDKLSVGCS